LLPSAENANSSGDFWVDASTVSAASGPFCSSVDITSASLSAEMIVHQSASAANGGIDIHRPRTRFHSLDKRSDCRGLLLQLLLMRLPVLGAHGFASLCTS